MKTCHALVRLVALIGALFSGAFVWAQGTFINLDFEDGTFVPVWGNPYLVQPGPALPGWTAYIGAGPAEYVLHNTVSLGSPAVSIHGPWSLQPPFHGDYCVMLQGGYIDNQAVHAAIAQTGQVPASAQSLRFYADNLMIRIVSFAGQDLPVFNLSGGLYGYQEYGADISMFAGHTGELRFTGGSGLLDFIRFSPLPIPEPTSSALFALGAFVWCWHMRRLV